MARNAHRRIGRLPRIAVMKWWRRKGEYAHQLREVEESVLRTCVRTWGQMLTYVFDRGDACGPWLEVLEKFRVKFIIRWIKKHLFYDQEGKEKKLWEIGRGKRYLAQKVIPDTTSGLQVARDLWWTPLRHPQYSQQLYLVKVRVKGKVWYLITHERVQTEEQAWEIFFACKRRWQIETSFRYGKCELAMQSPRLWLFENRLKLLGIVLLVYAFLLYLLEDVYKELVESLLRWQCHRTGKRCREALVPLSRLRWALSRLWDDSRPLLGSLLPPDWETLQALAPFQR